MRFTCPRCGAPLSLDGLEVEAKYREALPLVARLGRLGAPGLAYAEQWASPGRALQARRLVAVVEELVRLQTERAFVRRRRAVSFEVADLAAALDALAAKSFDPPLNSHAYLYSVIENKRDARLAREERRREEERKRARPGGSGEEKPLDPSSLPQSVRGVAARKLPPGRSEK